ncbi:MAG: hypothetical protein QOF78_4019 [Phycisphaerales bacterium]|jgi:uncharacterized membrane protein|nr:hypothetical protein [Phycisphaerales bacterium]
MSNNHVLYLGDTALSGAAAYLAGLMTRFGIGYDYLPSDQDLSSGLASERRKLFIISDYSAARMLPAVQEIILKQVHEQAAGLLMIGGWESFHGHGGDWGGTPIGNALPVEISAADDRVNCDQPALIIHSEKHEITANLPWAERPPTIGGFNRVISKPGAATILLVQRLQAVFSEGRFEFTPREQDPLLVLGSHGFGFTAALTTDLAPHWVGGLVDWGDGDRVTAQAPGSWQIEVGNFYSQFVVNLLTWTGQLHTKVV